MNPHILRRAAMVSVALMLALTTAMPVLNHLPATPAADSLETGSEPQPMDPLANDSSQAALEMRGLWFEPSNDRFPVPFIGRAAEATVAIDHEGWRVGWEDGALDFHVGSSSRITPESPLPGVVHDYGSGSWAQGIERFESVLLEDVAPGIDVRLRSSDGLLEFDHILAPGADPDDAWFRVDASAQPRVVDGSLLLETGAHTVRLAAPFTYQDDGTVVQSSFRVDGTKVSYDLGAYDPTQTLVIDPVLHHSGYIGNRDDQYTYEMDVRALTASTTEVVMVGRSFQDIYPTAFASVGVQYGGGSSSDGWLARFIYDSDTGLATPVHYVFLGGTSADWIWDVELAPNGDAYLAGRTFSTNFPTKDPLWVPGGTGTGDYDGSVRASSSTDAFAAVLDSAGGLTFSTYYGGGDTDEGLGVARLPTGELVIAVESDTAVAASEFVIPLINGPNTVPIGSRDIVVAVMDFQNTASNGGRAILDWSTVEGTTGWDDVYDVVANANGIYVTSDIVTAGAPQPFTSAGSFQPANAGGTDVHVLAIDPAGTNYLWGSFLGGTGTDRPSSLDLLPTGELLVGGDTWSNNFPMCPANCNPSAPASPYPTRSGFSSMGFVTQFDGNGAALLFSTYLGGSSTDNLYDVNYHETDPELMVASGATFSANYPRINTTLGTPQRRDISATVLNLSSGHVPFSTNYGGWDDEYGYGAAIDAGGNIYVAGYGEGPSGSNLGIPLINEMQAFAGNGNLDDDAIFAVFGKAPPMPEISVHSTGYASQTSTALNGNPYDVLTFEEITVDATVTLGRFPVDPSLTKWELKDGTTVLATRTATLAPDFSGVVDPAGLILTDDGTLEACIEVWDNDVGGSHRVGTDCVQLRWLNRPPTPVIQADFNPQKVGAPVNFSAALSTDMDGFVDPLTTTWDFGDSNTAAGITTTHTYANAGTYVVTATITDDDGATGPSSITQVIEVGPTALFSVEGTGFKPSDDVPLNDGSYAGDRVLQRWFWDWGDGHVDEYRAPYFVPSQVTHAYASHGSYLVTLTVDDGRYTDTYSQTVFVEPDVPYALDDAYGVLQDTSLSVAAPGLVGNDFHPAGYAMSVDSVTPPAHGTLSWSTDGSFTYTPNVGYIGPDAFTYRMTDGFVLSENVATVRLTVAEFPPPEAMFDASVVGQEVRFGDLSRVGYHAITSWEWTMGDGATHAVADPIHTYSQPGEYFVTLRVTDSFGLTDTHTALVTIEESRSAAEAGSQLPPANAGPDQSVREGDTVFLDGSGSESPLYPTHYTWRQTSGPDIVLADPHAAKPRFVAPDVSESTQMRFELVIYNGVDHSNPDAVTVTVEPRNRAPVAAIVIPSRTAWSGEQVTLDAQPSTDPDNDVLGFSWLQIDGPTVALDISGATATFTAPDVAAETVLRFELRVADGAESSAAQAVVTVVPSGLTRAWFEAQATGTDVEFTDESRGQGLRYFWDFGDGSPVNHQQAPQHAYANSGTYLVRLVVLDEDGRQDRFERTLVVAPDPPAPDPVVAPTPSQVPESRAPQQESSGFGVAVLLGAMLVSLVQMRRRG